MASELCSQRQKKWLMFACHMCNIALHLEKSIAPICGERGCLDLNAPSRLRWLIINCRDAHTHTIHFIQCSEKPLSFYQKNRAIGHNGLFPHLTECVNTITSVTNSPFHCTKRGYTSVNLYQPKITPQKTGASQVNPAQARRHSSLRDGDISRAITHHISVVLVSDLNRLTQYRLRNSMHDHSETCL